MRATAKTKAMETVQEILFPAAPFPVPPTPVWPVWPVLPVQGPLPVELELLLKPELLELLMDVALTTWQYCFAGGIS